MGKTPTKERTMTMITLEEAQAHLSEIIDRLQPGEPVVITRNDKPVARLLAEEKPKRKPRKPGNCKGMLTILADDDEHLKDFAEYME
jgi:prevent-host-death family protein